MKKLKVLVFFFAIALLSASSAFALQCKSGNYGSDECWTTGVLTTDEVGEVIAGTVMVYDFVTGINEGNSTDNAAFYVRTATSTDQGSYVAGVVQQTYTSSDRVQLLVRGKGSLRVNGAVTSGDRLYVRGGSNQQRGLATKTVNLVSTDAASRDKQIAFSLATTTAASTQDAYITIV